MGLYPKEIVRQSNNYSDSIMNIVSIDLEDYFMVSAFENVVKREDWKRYKSRIEYNTYRLLEILNEVQTTGGEDTPSPKATFFCLGWVAERFPNLIKEIHSQGHEIASHGYDHRVITSMSHEEFREDVRRTKAILEDLIGEEILGYRAPSYSITRRTLWTLKILAEEGYIYDSSIFPIHHDRYGIPDAPRLPFCIDLNGDDILSQFKNPQYFSVIGRYAQNRGKALDTSKQKSVYPGALSSVTNDYFFEFPISTFRIFGYNLPIGGGGYFRFFPLWFTLWTMRRLISKCDRPLVFYIHPWEIDPKQPRVYGLSLKSRIRHYSNIRKAEGRLKKVLREIPFSSFCEIIEGSDLNLNKKYHELRRR